jgi:hypothetical protein
MGADIWDESVWSEDDIKSMKQSIITLTEAAGEPMGTPHHNFPWLDVRPGIRVS